MIGLFAVCPPEPLVEFRILRIASHCPLRALHCRVPLLHLQVTLRQQQVHISVLRIFGRGCLQRRNGLRIVAGFIRAPPGLKIRILLDARRRHRRTRYQQHCQKSLSHLNHSNSLGNSQLLYSPRPRTFRRAGPHLPAAPPSPLPAARSLPHSSSRPRCPRESPVSPVSICPRLTGFSSPRTRTAARLGPPPRRAAPPARRVVPAN